MKMELRYRHVGLVVENMDRILEFYVGILGQEIVCDLIEEGDYWAALTGVPESSSRVVKTKVPDGSVIEIVEFLEPKAIIPSSMAYHLKGFNHLAYNVKEIDSQYEYLKKNGVKFISEVLTSPYDPVKTFFFKDPEENLLQFVEVLDPNAIREGLE